MNFDRYSASSLGIWTTLLVLTSLAVPNSSPAADEPPVNQLTPQEIADGWILLFDGQTLFGWEPETPAVTGWKVEDGAITCDPSSKGSKLIHKSVLRDFALSADFRISKGGNSGIHFRGMGSPTPFAAGKDANGKKTKTGYEAQIDDNDKRGLLHQTGSLYRITPASSLVAGEEQWRHYDILCEGDHIVLKVNGVVTSDSHDSKFPIGHLGISHHHPGTKVEFRNIKLKPLGLKSMFNGTDLAGWQPIEPLPGKADERLLKQNWTVKDGLLHVDVPAIDGVSKGGRGVLEYQTPYQNFIMQLEARTNGPAFNSGVFFRSIPGQMANGYESQIQNAFKDGDRTQPVDFGTGAIYRRIAARKVVPDDNQFFSKTILAYGPYIGVWVNGYQVTDWTDTRPANVNAREGCCANPGAIALQSHDPTTNLDFRNLRIAEIAGPAN